MPLSKSYMFWLPEASGTQTYNQLLHTFTWPYGLLNTSDVVSVRPRLIDGAVAGIS